MYPTGGTNSNIGTLLRLIQEDQSKNPALLPPGSETGDPLRGVVQQPLVSPEAPGSSRVVSVRPEGVTQQGPTGESPVIAPGSAGPAPATPGVIGPRAPIVPVQAPAPSGPSNSAPGPSSPGPSSAPSRPSSPAPAPAPKITVSSLPKIGTRIISTPKPSSVGGRIVQNTQKKRSFA